MKRIDLDDRKPDRLTAMVYGHSGTGKTEFAATWPRPFIIGDAVEGGYETVKHMERGKWYEPERKPIVALAETMDDLPKLIKEAADLAEKKLVQTIVFDQVTLWLDVVQDFFQATHMQDIAKNKYFLPGKIYSHARHMAIAIHKVPNVHVVWTALAQWDLDSGRMGGPLLPGQTAKKLPAICKMVLFANVERKGPDDAPEFQIRSRPYDRYIARTRLGAKILDPLPPDPINPAWGPTYRSIEMCLKEPAVVKPAVAPKVEPPQPIKPAVAQK